MIDNSPKHALKTWFWGIIAYILTYNSPKALWITLITFAGLNHNEHSGNVICELTADDLFTE